MTLHLHSLTFTDPEGNEFCIGLHPSP